MKFTGELFDVYFSVAKTPADSRVDVAVGVRVSKKAVIRNLIKRRLREILRKYAVVKDFPGRYYVKISAKPPITGRQFGHIKESLEIILDKIK